MSAALIAGVMLGYSRKEVWATDQGSSFSAVDWHWSFMVMSFGYDQHNEIALMRFFCKLHDKMRTSAKKK